MVAGVAVLIDITAEKQIQQERERLLQVEREARQEAEAAVRARDEFLSVAAHELKTPLTSLRGYAQVLLRQMRKTGELDTARVAQAMGQIDQQTQRLSSLVNQLLDLARIEVGKLVLDRKAADVAGLAEGVAATLQRIHPDRRFAVNVPGPILATFDALRLEQVLTNLLDNACKFSPPDAPVELCVTPAGRQARIEVRDHGTGIPPDQWPHISDRFYQAHNGEWHGGMGLGLYVSRQIVELHGGSITVDCPAEGGSRFTVTLPDGEKGTGGNHGRAQNDPGR